MRDRVVFRAAHQSYPDAIGYEYIRILKHWAYSLHKEPFTWYVKKEGDVRTVNSPFSTPNPLNNQNTVRSTPVKKRGFRYTDIWSPFASVTKSTLLTSDITVPPRNFARLLGLSRLGQPETRRREQNPRFFEWRILTNDDVSNFKEEQARIQQGLSFQQEGKTCWSFVVWELLRRSNFIRSNCTDECKRVLKLFTFQPGSGEDIYVFPDLEEVFANYRVFCEQYWEDTTVEERLLTNNGYADCFLLAMLKQNVAINPILLPGNKFQTWPSHGDRDLTPQPIPLTDPTKTRLLCSHYEVSMSDDLNYGSIAQRLRNMQTSRGGLLRWVHKEQPDRGHFTCFVKDEDGVRAYDTGGHTELINEHPSGPIEWKVTHVFVIHELERPLQSISTR